jgi:hypothetical protein
MNSNSPVQFSRKIQKPSKFKNKQLDGGSLGKTNIKHCRIICRVELDTVPGKIKSNAEFISTLDQQVIMVRKCNRCIRDQQANSIRRKYGNKNQFKRIRERQREDKGQEKSSSFIRHETGSFIHRSATSKPHGALNVGTTMPYDLHELRPCVQYE